MVAQRIIPLIPDLSPVLNFAATVWLAVSVLLYGRGWRFVRGTTLDSAWWWGWTAWALWGVSWALELNPGILSPGVLDQMWYAVALLLLAALVSVLGAKRPGSRVWTWFVTVPMLLVLGWPALFAWSQGWPPESLRVMAPALWAYALVCVMGLGNYVGTRFLPSAVWMGVALFWLVMPYSGWVSEMLPSPTGCRLRATLCAGMAVIWPAVLAASVPFLAPWDRVWVDFVNSFGIVWGRRLQDRFNETARQAKWGVKLDLYGLAWDDAPSSTPSVERPRLPRWTPEMIHALQWLLRRFVDQDWLEKRVGKGGEAHFEGKLE